MSAKLPKHKDLDADLWPGLDNSPLSLFLKLGCLATMLIAIASWLALLGVMTAGWLPWMGWPYLVVPVAIWLVLLALPALFTARRGTLAILDAIAMTAEAWLARAGYSVDLNNDGYIGHVQPVTIEPVQTQVTQPMLYRSPQGTKLLTNEAQTAIKSEEALANASPDIESDAPIPEPITRRLWKLPNDIKCPQETIEEFVERIFLRGWSRADWVPKHLDRDTYDGLIILLEQANILEGRKPGYKGKLTVDNGTQARQVLGLSSPNQPTPSPAAEEADTSLVGRYEPV